MPLKAKLSPLDLARLAAASDRVGEARACVRYETLRLEVHERDRATLARVLQRRYGYTDADHIDPETGVITRREG